MSDLSCPACGEALATPQWDASTLVTAEAQRAWFMRAAEELSDSLARESARKAAKGPFSPHHEQRLQCACGADVTIRQPTAYVASFCPNRPLAVRKVDS